MLQWIQKYKMGPNLQRAIQRVTQNCMICAKNNAKTAARHSTPHGNSVLYTGTCPTENWQVDELQETSDTR